MNSSAFFPAAAGNMQGIMQKDKSDPSKRNIAERQKIKGNIGPSFCG
jgi:hypothetical protein